MVDVPHDRDDRGAALEGLSEILGLLERLVLRHFRIELDFKSELVSDERNGVFVQALVDGHHDAEFHALLDNVCDVHPHQVREVADRHEFGHTELP